MKKMLLMAFVLIISACSKSEDSTSDNSSKIIGKWYAIQFRAPDEPMSDCDKESYMSFRPDNTFSEIYSGDGATSGGITECRTYQPSLGKWRFEDEVLILEYDAGFTYYINEYEITSTKLTLKIVEQGEVFIDIFEKR